MDIEKILSEKALKPKIKVERLAALLIEKKLGSEELLSLAGNLEPIQKANCIEALEFATKTNPSLASVKCLKYLSNLLKDEAPRVKWEAARAIGNIAHLYPKNLGTAINNLLANTEDKGTVVRWSSAFALGEIIKMNMNINKTLIPAVEAICKREEDNGVRKKYLNAIEKVRKTGKAKGRGK